jgi:hypothetical protein
VARKTDWKKGDKFRWNAKGDSGTWAIDADHDCIMTVTADVDSDHVTATRIGLHVSYTHKGKLVNHYWHFKYDMLIPLDAGSSDLDTIKKRGKFSSSVEDMADEIAERIARRGTK